MRRVQAMAACVVWAGLLATVPACGTKETKGAAAVPPAVKGVTLETVTVIAVPDLLEGVGTVKARNAAVLAARIAGTVTAVHVREGDRVAKGKLLVSLDAVENAAGAAGARAGVTEAERGVQEALSRQKLAEATFGRFQKLFQEEAVTRQEFEGRQMEREVAGEGLARAEARLVQAREASRAAGATAAYSRVTSPLAGIVTARGVDAGMTVFPGTVLVTVEEEGSYRLEVATPESVAGKVQPGQTVKVAIDGPALQLDGRVVEVVPVMDHATRTFTVKVDIAGNGLRSGMYGRARFPVGTRKGLFVPAAALVERGALTSLWVVGEDRIARMRLVKSGREESGKVEILAGLSAGERIVTGGTDKVVDGAKVEEGR